MGNQHERSIGTRRGGTGSAAQPMTNRNAVAVAGDRSPPEKWTQRDGLRLLQRTSIVTGQSPWMVECESEAAARKALDEALMWMSPASLKSLVDALNDLYMIALRRPEASDDQVAVVLLTARALETYPGDLALQAVRTYRGNFFPTAEELRLKIEAMPGLRERSAKIKALRYFIEHGPEPQPKEISQEERDRVSKGLRKLHAELGGSRPSSAADEQTKSPRRTAARKRKAPQRGRKSQEGAQS